MDTTATHETADADAPPTYPTPDLRLRATEIAAGGVPALRQEAREQTRAFAAATGAPADMTTDRFAAYLLHALTNLNADALLALCADDPTLFTTSPELAEAIRRPSAFDVVMEGLRATLRAAIAEEISHAREDAASPPWAGEWVLTLRDPEGRGTTVGEADAGEFLKHAWRRESRTPRIRSDADAALAASLGWEVHVGTGNVFHSTASLPAGTRQEEARRLIRSYRRQTEVYDGLNYSARAPRCEDAEEQAAAA